MDEIKREFTSWWILGAVLLALTGVGAFVFNSCGLIAGTAVERKVFEQSYQLSASKKGKIAAYKAQIAALRGQLSGASDEVKDGIEGQIQSLQILLAAETEE